MPPCQSLQQSQPPPITFQNQQYSYQPGPPLPVPNQSPQQVIISTIGIPIFSSFFFYKNNNDT